MTSRIITALERRWKWAQLGVYFLRSRDLKPKRLTIAGKTIALQFPPGEEPPQQYELDQIYLGDCYRLRGLREVQTVVDIGANIGLFSMIARHYFPVARIEAYEPNPLLRDTLRRHLSPLDITIHHEAVGLHDGRAAAVAGAGSLQHQVKAGAEGDMIMVGVDTVLKRIGGPIDFLKLDCEGGEWEILQSDEFMRNVRTLAMEYHPQKQDVPVLNELILLLRRHRFHRVEIHQRVDESWGLLHASRT